MPQIAKHDGVVKKVEERLVTVEMHVLSACASCKAKSSCTFVDKAEKLVEVETADWQQYQEGDTVVVSVNESLGLLAVLLAYVLPALLLVGMVVVMTQAGFSELAAAGIPLLLVVFYFLILYILRNKLQKKFSFGISPHEQNS